MRIFIGPLDVAGIAHGFHSGFESAGTSATIVLSQPHPFKYGGAIRAPLIARIWKRLGGINIALGRDRIIRKAAVWLAWRAWSWIVLGWALARFDSFIFIFGVTITGTRLEVTLHRWLGKRVLVIYCGSDARPPYIDGPTCHDGLDVDFDELGRRTADVAERVRRFDAAGFIAVNSPMTGQFHVKPYVNWFAMGVPRDLPAGTANVLSKQRTNDVVRILHSPSHPKIKGSDDIAKMIHRLTAKGHAVELIELRGVSNQQVVTELQNCDFVVDQLYSDTPMAGFATEAAFYGKPAVVGSHAAQQFEAKRDAWSLPPSFCVPPDAVEAAIEQLVTDAAYRLELGRLAQAFVREHWSPVSVAKRYIALLHGEVPDGWLVKPGYVYCEGCGLPFERARAVVAGLIHKQGLAALQLGHSPDLEAAFAAFGQGAAVPLE